MAFRFCVKHLKALSTTRLLNNFSHMLAVDLLEGDLETAG
jgi:hypothetical protein